MKNVYKASVCLVVAAAVQILLGAGLAEGFGGHEAVFPAMLLNAGIVVIAGAVALYFAVSESSRKAAVRRAVAESRLWE